MFIPVLALYHISPSLFLNTLFFCYNYRVLPLDSGFTAYIQNRNRSRPCPPHTHTRAKHYFTLGELRAIAHPQSVRAYVFCFSSSSSSSSSFINIKMSSILLTFSFFVQIRSYVFCYYFFIIYVTVYFLIITNNIRNYFFFLNCFQYFFMLAFPRSYNHIHTHAYILALTLSLSFGCPLYLSLPCSLDQSITCSLSFPAQTVLWIACLTRVLVDTWIV